MAVLFLHTTPGRKAASQPAGTWGMQMTVRVTTVPGGPGLDSATASAARILQARMDARHWDQATAEVVAAGTVRVTVPWAQSVWQIDGITSSTRFELLDSGKGVIATSETDPLWFRHLHGAPGSAWYLLSRDGRMLLDGPRARPGWPTRAGVRVRPQKGVSLIVTGVNRAYAVVGADAVRAHGDQIEAVTWTGSRELMVETSLPLTGPLWLAEQSTSGRPWVVATIAATSSPSTTTRLRMAPAQGFFGPAIAQELAGGAADAELTRVGAGWYGEPPARRGERITPPTQVGKALMQSRAPRSSVLRVLRELKSGAEVWEGVARGGDSVAVATIPGSNQVAITLGCQLGPEHRVMLRCRLNRGEWIFGRVAPGVASVQARTLGEETTLGMVRNGWFAVPRPRRDAHIAIDALDANGKVLATLP
ncbi:MAG: hypothetical protein U0Y82_01910 [Thermoleophilia bacterium]